MPRARSTGSAQHGKKQKNRTRRVRSASPETNLLFPLFNAVRRQDIQKIRRLIKNRALRSKDFAVDSLIPFLDTIKKQIANLALLNVLQEEPFVNAYEIFGLLRDSGLEFSSETIRPELFIKSRQFPEIFDILIDNGFDVNTKHEFGHTVLMSVLGDAIRDNDDDDNDPYNLFTKQEYTNLINRLFDLGADINIQDNNGLDALMIATGHEALDEFWVNLYNDGNRYEIRAKPYYVNLLLENLKRTRQRYNFTNVAQNGEDFGGEKYTLEESLDSYGRENNDPQEYTETVELIREYKLALRKPTKTANFGMVRKPASKSRSRSRSRSSGASEGGGKKKTKRNKPRRRNKK